METNKLYEYLRAVSGGNNHSGPDSGRKKLLGPMRAVRTVVEAFEFPHANVSYLLYTIIDPLTLTTLFTNH